MDGGDWLDLERMARGIPAADPAPAAAVVAEAAVVDRPTSTPRSQGKQTGQRRKVSSAGPSRAAAEEARSAKRQRATLPPYEVEFELDEVGPEHYEAFKRDPLMVCSDVCRSASKVLQGLKCAEAGALKERDAALREKDAALKERDAALKRLAELAADRDKQVAEAEKARKVVEDDRTRMVNELTSQIRDLQEQVGRAQQEKAEAVSAEMRKVAGKALGAAVFQFGNAVAQMKVLNTGHDFLYDETIIDSSHMVQEGEIVLPQRSDESGHIYQQRKVIFARPDQQQPST